MTMSFRAVRLRAKTSIGSFGATVTFVPGLNVVRGANSRGKTQVLQALVFGLGLEGMFGPGRSTGLGSAMTRELLAPAPGGGERIATVSQSWCAVEIENHLGDIITAQRAAVHPTIRSNLVRLWRGPRITRPESAVHAPEVLFVRESGGAQRAVGFHYHLENFLHLELPEVPRYAGADVHLYLEAIAPFLYVDQRAWGSAAPRAITHLQLREPTRRAAEFLIGLSGPKTQSRRYRLEETLTGLRAEWLRIVAAAQAAVAAVGGRISGLPDVPRGALGTFRGEVVGSDLRSARIEVLLGGEWTELDRTPPSFDAALPRPTPSGANVPTVQEVGSNHLREELRNAEVELSDLLATAVAVEQTASLADAEVGALDRRIDALTEELSRNRDVRTLLRLGAEHTETHLADENCPTCRQPLAGVEADLLGPTLDVDDTLGLLNAQAATARAMREKAQQVLDQAKSAFAAVQRETDAVRVRVKALRSDLTAPDGSPSAAVIAARITDDLRAASLSRALEAFDGYLPQLQAIADQIASVRSELNALPTTIVDADAVRIEQVATSMRQQLEEFGFSSYSPDQLGLDEETLRPRRSGFDLDTDVSATDVVRVKIAYLNAIREIGRSYHSPHPGWLVLDEPRQHELDEEHFRSTLRRLGRSHPSDSQVIVTSAASAQSLAILLGDEEAEVVDLGQARLLHAEDDLDTLDLPSG